MTPPDPNRLFAQAEDAFRRRDYAAARCDLLAIRRTVGVHPVVAHLAALVEQADRRPDAACAAFADALAAAPNDPQIANNYANLLHDLGRTADALALFGTAIAAHPDVVDLRRNRALTLLAVGDPAAALADIAVAMRLRPDVVTVTAQGQALLALGRLDAAADAFDAALAAEPQRLAALKGRAQIALARGEPDAVARYRTLHARPDRDPATLLGLAEALEAVGDPAGLALLTDAVTQQPDWIDGQERLARMRSEAGMVDDCAEFRAGLARRPRDAALHAAYWQALARGGRHAAALVALEDSGLCGTDPAYRLTEAVLASEADQPERATALFATLPRSFDGDLAHGRHALRNGDPAAAAARLEACVAERPDAVSAWAHLGLAWSVLEDPRADWLYRPDVFVRTHDLSLDQAALADLAERLRGLHRTRAHPIGQSLRGGTQTRAALFAHHDPAIRALRDRLAAAVAAHVTALPPVDAAHPLLRHRHAAFAFAGSWSVRLSASGFHVSHIHPMGVLSSACYIALPAAVADEEARAGWLEIGRPPAALGLDLPPFATIRPQPGRLVLFPSYVFHGTRPFADGERLSVAFDVTAS
ncbi:putative 2OG-Fe(II) oxygenase [Sphingomonas prati]|uniref:Tetratricopeptide (TPR) repeat protein n=1 Tax=Sphingomonas prati TaxID=1843237 RepID=A0A7W9F2S9_9SPHN|nr:putative 2OG-Fe(II) oxygenase [Sphingomonas prati]MBB5728780.1 tetratricopeptide (TPR) repeat protein [Sphingomonas prati]GGE87598.1 hypothetical protein GCM10011404_20520 [Sphingomonas prati]